MKVSPIKIVIVVISSLRADVLGAAGGLYVTPTLDRLAREGASLPFTFAAGSSAAPSLAAIETGRLPHRVGVARWGQRPDLRGPGLFGLAAAAGLSVHGFFPDPERAFSGWPARGIVGDSQDTAAVCAALRGLDRLVYIHYTGTHFPYTQSPRPWAERASEAALGVEAIARLGPGLRDRFKGLYRRSVEHFSELVLPRYLDAMGDQALLVLTGDHGESWGEHTPEGRPVEQLGDLHGRWLHDDTTQVPLIFWGESPVGRFGAPRPLGEAPLGSGGPRLASTVDIAPTLASLMGWRWSGPTDGAPLGATLLYNAPSPRQAALTVASAEIYEAAHDGPAPPAGGPPEGAARWRGFSLRGATSRLSWDARSGLAHGDLTLGLSKLQAEYKRGVGLESETI